MVFAWRQRQARPARDALRILAPGGTPTQLGDALAQYGRIVKTLHILSYVDDEPYRREIKAIRNLQEGRHDVGRTALHGRKGELRICTDFAPEMVAVARSRGAALGLTNVEYQVLDAERIELDSESVDCVLCRWGYILMENPALALRETRRVLRSGGRLALSVWSEPADNAWASVPAGVFVNGGWLEPPLPGAPGIFALAAPERLRHVLADAGFNDPQLDQIDVVWPFA